MPNLPFAEFPLEFRAKVTKVHDGDTIHLYVTYLRNEPFTVRLADIDAPDKGEPDWENAQDFLEGQILDEEVEAVINPNNRVDKWGRLLAKIKVMGIDMGDQLVRVGLARSWRDRSISEIPNLKKELLKWA